VGQAPSNKEHMCERCAKAFPSHVRLQHHLAAEHAIKTLKDIKTSRDVMNAAPKGGA